MNQSITNTPPGKAWKMCVPMWPWLAGGNRNIPNHTNQSSRLSSVWRLPNKQWLHAVYFFLPSPSPILTRQPLPWNQFLTRPTLGQFECSNWLHCKICLLCRFRFGNTLTINKFEKWCFEKMSGLKCDNVTFNGTILKTNGCHSFLKPTYRCLDITL